MLLSLLLLALPLDPVELELIPRGPGEGMICTRVTGDCMRCGLSDLVVEAAADGVDPAAAAAPDVADVVEVGVDPITDTAPRKVPVATAVAVVVAVDPPDNELAVGWACACACE